MISQFFCQSFSMFVDTASDNNFKCVKFLRIFSLLNSVSPFNLLFMKSMKTLSEDVKVNLSLCRRAFISTYLRTSKSVDFRSILEARLARRYETRTGK